VWKAEEISWGLSMTCLGQNWLTTLHRYAMLLNGFLAAFSS
jgi:hypothetical protein